MGAPTSRHEVKHVQGLTQTLAGGGPADNAGNPLKLTQFRYSADMGHGDRVWSELPHVQQDR